MIICFYDPDCTHCKEAIPSLHKLYKKYTPKELSIVAFNISDDIGESNDLSAQHPDIVKKLSKELGSYLRKVDAQRPAFNATGKPCPWPDEVK